jgi:hypothetical protein
MAIATDSLILILKKTVDLLEETESYQWGHMGSCNCGHLAQVITGKTHAQIHNMAMMTDGDWSDKAEKYCKDSGLPIDDIIKEMLAHGFELDDIRHIEYLSHPKIVKRLIGTPFQHRRNSLEDVILYFKAWIDELENKLDFIKTWTPRVHEKEVVIYDSVPETEFA